MSEQANNSFKETGPMATTTEAVDFLMGKMADSHEGTPEVEDHEADHVEIEATETDDDELQHQGEEAPEIEAEAEDDGAEYEDEEEVTYVQIGEEEIPLTEIEQGYLRQSDYTKKMQVLAKDRQEAEKQAAQHQQELAAIQAEREHLRHVLSQVSQEQEQEPNWLDLAENDPLEYTRQKAMHDAKTAERAAKQAEKQRLEQISYQEKMARFQQYAQQQKDVVLEAIPEVKQNAKYMRDVETYLEGVAGYSKDELARMYDARAIILADKARKYDELVGKTKKPAASKKVNPKGKVLRPAVQKSKGEKVDAQRQQLRAKARKTGSVQDAVSSLLS